MESTEKGTTMTYGEAVQDPTTNLGAMAAQTKNERKQAIAALMAQGMTLEQAAAKWATSLFA